jgi:hypothetical protein
VKRCGADLSIILDLEWTSEKEMWRGAHDWWMIPVKTY